MCTFDLLVSYLQWLVGCSRVTPQLTAYCSMISIRPILGRSGRTLEFRLQNLGKVGGILFNFIVFHERYIFLESQLHRRKISAFS